MKTYNLATIPGDGIGPEVVTQGLRVLDAVAKKYDLEFKKTNYELGAAYWHKTKETLPDSVMAELAKADVILLGAVGDPTVPSGVLERGLLLKIPIVNNKDIDFVVVREGTEGLYVGAGSLKDEGTNKELAIEESINTYKGVERVIRDAFNRAVNRPRKKLTLVHKNNVLARAGGLWTRVFNEVAKDFPQVTTDYLHVDAASMFFVTNPDRFDVVVTDNLFGDIITDIAAAVCGGIGLAASGNINPTGAFPSMFEPVHGSAPDIAGKNIADPTATVLSIAMMLNHLGQTQAANEVEEAVAKDLLNRGEKKRSTSEIGDALVMGIL
jgi:3-isopropylmalate dehydrogenase